MTRLKIVDQSDLVVPYRFPAREVTLAFNGEIYNWRELRSELPGPWDTQCDAEVVAAAWREWGPECLDRFNGMWGLVLVDHLKNEIFIARDRAGEKPIYYAVRHGTLHVASEIKAFPFELEEVPCVDADVLEFDCGPSTPFASVYALDPGGAIALREPHHIRQPVISQWWSLPLQANERCASLSDTVDELTELVTDAIKIRNVSDVPVALQLSGGLDSAIIQAVVKSERLYCVTFPDDGVDNLTAANWAAHPNPRGRYDRRSKLPSRSIVPVSFTRDDLLGALSDVAYHLDTPATWTAVCQWFMSKKIAEDGNVVVLSGEGADELFGGYARYRVLQHLDGIGNDKFLVDYGPLIARSLGTPDEILCSMLDRSGGLANRRAMWLINKHAPVGSLPARMARTDFYTTMQVLLRMADRMASAFSLENRSPFLDYRVMEMSAKIPIADKINDYGNKAVLRFVAKRLGVRDNILEERTKKGLFVPPSWGQGEKWDRAWFRDLIAQHWRERMLNE